MSVFPEFHIEYEKRHREIWEDLKIILKEYGVNSYSIFLNKETSQLFAYLEIEDETKWNEIANTEICKKWWVYMKDIMPTNADNSPISEDLKIVFSLD